jgi:RHS repeat-associated protein
LQLTRYYSINYEKEIRPNNAVRELNYIYAGDGLAAIFVRNNSTVSNNDTMYYVYKDHLGSICYITDGTGSVKHRMSYDAWGKRRNPKDWTYNFVLPANYPTLFDRGYTQHEHLDEIELINMNGRMYDPVLGRFLSPDIVVQSAENTQSYNRFSYAVNNPLKYIDINGFTYTGSDVMQETWNRAVADIEAWQESISEYWWNLGHNQGLNEQEGGVGRGYSIGGDASLSEVEANLFKFDISQLDQNREKYPDISINQYGNIRGWFASSDGDPQKANYILIFDVRKGTLSVVNDVAGVVYSTSATSGNGEYMNDPNAQDLTGKGPIPEGTYYFYNDQWNYQNTFRQILNIVRGNGDWGYYNVPLHPVESQPRNSFYLHGGFFIGSGGCIDVGGDIWRIYLYVHNQKTTIVKVNN